MSVNHLTAECSRLESERESNSALLASAEARLLTLHENLDIERKEVVSLQFIIEFLEERCNALYLMLYRSYDAYSSDTTVVDADDEVEGGADLN